MVTKDLITRYEMYPEDENWNTTKIIIYEYKNCYIQNELFSESEAYA